MSTPTSQQLRAMAGSPERFRDSLLVDVDGEARPVGEVATDLQRMDFAAADPAWRRLADATATEPKHRRFYFERGRGGSKTTDLAVAATWALGFSRRRLRLVAAASDLDQARLLRDAICGLLSLNPWLRGLVKADKNRVANERTGSALEILSADVGSSYGLTPDAVLIDELTHWRDGGEELWHSLFSSASKRKSCVVCIISNAGFGKGESWQWQVRESARTSGHWYFHQWPGPAQWMDAATLEEMRATLPALVYRRLFENEWTAGEGDALTPEEIDRAVVLAGPMSGKAWGWQFALGLDLGLKRDFAAAVVLGKHVGGLRKVDDDGELRPVSRLSAILEDIGCDLFPGDEGGSGHIPQAHYEETKGTGKVRLAAARVWKPEGGEIDLDSVEAEAKRLASLFRCAIFADPWEGRAMVQRFRKAGLQADAVDATGGNLESQALELLSAFRENRVELFDHSQLLADLRALRIVEKSYGFRLESPRSKAGGHGDAASAFGLALLGLKRIGRRRVPTVPAGRRLAY